MTIRTLGVSLVTLAAIAASVTLARHTRAIPGPAEPQGHPDGRIALRNLNLEAIRVAGL